MISLVAKGEQRVESRRFSNNSLRIAAENMMESNSQLEAIEKEKRNRAIKQVRTNNHYSYTYLYTDINMYDHKL